MIETAEWVLIGVLIGSPIGFIISSVLTSDKMEDLDTEVQDLRTQRQLLKEEIFRLSKSRIERDLLGSEDSWYYPTSESIIYDCCEQTHHR